MLLGCAMLTAGDALMKSLVQALPVGQVVGLRAVFALGAVLLLAPWAGGFGKLRVVNPRSVLLVSALLVFNLFVFPFSLRYMPLADAIILAYTSPIWVVALAPMILKERTRWPQWLAVTIGFAGACLVIKPDGAVHWAVSLPLVVALSVGLRDIMTRKIAATEHALAIVLYANLLSILIGLATLPLGWLPVGMTQWGQLAMAGVFLSVAQFLMIEGFRLVEASILSTIKYSSILFAAAFGYLFWGEMLDIVALLGALMIVLSGVLIVCYRNKPVTTRSEVLPRATRSVE